MQRDGEQNLCQNIKKEVYNASYFEQQDPIAITDQDRLAQSRIRIKEEIDIKEEELPEGETGNVNLQRRSSGDGIRRNAYVKNTSSDIGVTCNTNLPHTSSDIGVRSNTNLPHAYSDNNVRINTNLPRAYSDNSVRINTNLPHAYSDNSVRSNTNLPHTYSDNNARSNTDLHTNNGLTGYVDLPHASVDSGLTSNADLPHEPNDIDLRLLLSGLLNKSSPGKQNVETTEKRITRRDKQISSELSVFQHKNNKNSYEETSDIASKTMNSHNDNEKYACGSCDQRYSEIVDLKNHIKLAHLLLADYKCVQCKQTFFEPYKLKKHICYKNVMFYECEFCKRQFLNQGNLKQHSVVHKNLQNLKCDVCKKEFLGSVQKDGKLVCNDCSGSFIESSKCGRQTATTDCQKRSETAAKELNINRNDSNSINKKGIDTNTIDTQDSDFSNIQGPINAVHSKEKSTALQNNDRTLSMSSNTNKHACECIHCNKMFSRPSHLRKHNCLKTYDCKVCDRKFSRRVHLKQHSFVHDRIDEFSKQANKSFSQFSESKDLLKPQEDEVGNEISLHQFTPTQQKEKKFTCNDCDKTFLYFSTLRNHITSVHHQDGLVITSDKIYACDNCDERYSVLVDLKKHIRVEHSKAARCKCALCSKTFSFSQYFRLRRHINVKHKIRESNIENKDKKFSCDECDKGYTAFRDIKTHIEGTHLGLNEYKCVQCNKSFSRFSEFKRHFNSNGHKNYKKFDCDICKKKFSHLSLLKSHMAMHNRTQKFVCKICGKGFFIISMLNIHMNSSHIKSKDHQCEQCGKAFVQKNQLEKHVNGVHYKIRDYECQYCYKRFQQIHHLRNHIICVHERVKNFVCEQCGSKFLLAHHLRNHVNAVHKGIKVKAYPKFIWPGNPFS